ncbi:hypothetical protein NUW54_g12675 [Trametes sanguinea]|uniref:Uncharacterized protein n=1 Tax=Trametes sanguinea TaxID=158606 RepID=A0ACC1MUM4_9APHY|nr:hypothetical protein NUW54_g12675 [Trametes sanguinea]
MRASSGWGSGIKHADLDVGSADKFTIVPSVCGERSKWFRRLGCWSAFASGPIAPLSFKSTRTNIGASPAILSHKSQHPAYFREQ